MCLYIVNCFVLYELHDTGKYHLTKQNESVELCVRKITMCMIYCRHGYRAIYRTA